MKKSLVYIILLGSLINCDNNQSTVQKNISREVSDTSFEYHFKILDSAVKANPHDTIYACCTPSIKFMEVKTGIEAQTGGTYFGKLNFFKEDLQKWHEWYDKKYEKNKD